MKNYNMIIIFKIKYPKEMFRLCERRKNKLTNIEVSIENYYNDYNHVMTDMLKISEKVDSKLRKIVDFSEDLSTEYRIETKDKDYTFKIYFCKIEDLRKDVHKSLKILNRLSITKNSIERTYYFINRIEALKFVNENNNGKCFTYWISNINMN